MSTLLSPNNPSHSTFRLLLLTFGLVIGMNVQSANVTWKINISPKGAGEVLWSTTQPFDSGALFSSGAITAEQGSLIHLTFIPFGGYKLASVYKNLDDWTPFLDDNNHYQFGPVESKHVIIVKYAPITPTGSFDLQAPELLPEGVAPIYDLTGHYSGNVPMDVPQIPGRSFDGDVAMDESGKLDIILNSFEGYSGDDKGTGKVQTVNDRPQITVSASGKGSFDGTNGEGSGSATLSNMQALSSAIASINAQNAEPQLLDISGTAAYKIKLKNTDTGVKLALKGKNEDFALPVSTDTSRAWSVNILIEQRTADKGQIKTYAKAALTLPTGETINFSERTVKYSVKKGYNLKFTNGINPVTLKPDKKSKLAIKKMLFNCSENACSITDGQLQYRFLGQKGTAKLTDFIQALPPT